MKSYKLINNITGWSVFFIATLVYILTVEETASFWDCGEFIACAYKLQVPHPPGAPFFLLLGKFFSLFAGDDVTQVAYWVNMMSVLASGFTILFLFWTITMLAKKIVAGDEENPGFGKNLSIMGAGVIGALAYAFSDSFWFSAEEAEVYAMSSFFTAVVFWAMLKWESIADKPESDRWLLLIAYLMGLSIGVHLLNLVTIPAMAFIFYFKKKKFTMQGALITFAIGVLLVGVILSGIITGLPTIAKEFEIFFINGIGLPFGMGIIIFSLLLLGGLIYGFMRSIRENNRVLNISLLSLTFILIGYASYAIIVIRTQFDPPIDENDPENIMTYVSYLNREQYGDRPLLFGATFNAPPVDTEPVNNYRKGEEEYEEYQSGMEYEYDEDYKILFPRIWSSRDRHPQAYMRWTDIDNPREPIRMGDNISYFVRYQLGHMYWRYFMWNFSGREGDFQDADWLAPWDAAKDTPEYLKNDKAHNNFFMLPFILGVVGLVFHYMKRKNDTFIVFLLFFFTGIGIIIYLNQPPVEPRERDYISVGSYYAFAIWIGLGVLAVAEGIRKYLVKDNKISAIIATVACLIVPVIMVAEGWDDHDRSGRYHSVDSAKNLLMSCAPNSVVFTGGDNDTFPLWYVQEVEGFRTDVRVCNLSLLNTDWYIQQMKKNVYESEALPISFEEEDYQMGTNDYASIGEGKQPVDLIKYLKGVKEDDPTYIRRNNGYKLSQLPSGTVYLNVDKKAVLANNFIDEKEEGQIVSKMQWTLGKAGGNILKKDLIILDMIANNNWERPIYFSTSLGQNNLGLSKYLRQEGYAYRLVPLVKNRAPEKEIMYDNMINKTVWRGMDDPGAFLNEDYRRMAYSARIIFFQLAYGYYSEGDTTKAREVMQFCLDKMPDEAIPYGDVMTSYAGLYLEMGDKEKAKEILNILIDRSTSLLAYYADKGGMQAHNMFSSNMSVLERLISILKSHDMKEELSKITSWYKANQRDIDRMRNRTAR